MTGEPNTLAKLFRHRAQTDGPRIALREKDLGVWKDISWAAYYDAARATGCRLLQLGLAKGDVISVLSENVKEWLYCEMGAAGVGVITAGVYPTDAPAQLLYLLNNSSARILFVENEEQLDKYLEIKDKATTVEKVVVFDWEGLHHFRDEGVESWDDFLAAGVKDAAGRSDEWEAAIDASAPEDIISLIYTSGTTGQPKGAMINHKNALCQIRLARSLYGQREDDRQISFLPLCHIAEKVFTTIVPLESKAIVHFVEKPDTLMENMQEVAPTIFFSVPRIWEKLYSMISIHIKEATRTGRLFYHLTLRHGSRRHESAFSRLVYGLLSPLVLRNIRKVMGMNRLRIGFSGAAPISPELLNWLTNLGIPIYEVFGQTESSGLATGNSPGHKRTGSIGRAIDPTEVHIAEDGEILLRGDHVFAGYWRNQEKTAETVREGWLHTGDVGEQDGDGYVRITGRMKEIIITSGGKNISPAAIETEIKASPFVSDAVVIGDRRKFLTCLIMIDYDNVEKFANDSNLPFTDFKSLCGLPGVVALIDEAIAATNKKFARVEQIKQFRLIDRRLYPEDEELTATMKLKRDVVARKYQSLIETMYS